MKLSEVIFAYCVAKISQAEHSTDGMSQRPVASALPWPFGEWKESAERLEVENEALKRDLGKWLTLASHQIRERDLWVT